MKMINGASLIRVTASTARAPIPTPRILIDARNRKTNRITAKRPTGFASGGINSPTETAIRPTIPEMASIAVRK